VKLPRDVSGSDLVKALAKLGYTVTRQTGSHMRLTTTERASIT
jgi:predicted RNA binding protein YcfA (HicA-like mRNA interferase family)